MDSGLEKKSKSISITPNITLPLFFMRLVKSLVERALLTILVWGLILEILCVIYLSSTPWKFEFAYSVFLLIVTLAALILLLIKMKASLRDMRSSIDVKLAN